MDVVDETYDVCISLDSQESCDRVELEDLDCFEEDCFEKECDLPQDDFNDISEDDKELTAEPAENTSEFVFTPEELDEYIEGTSDIGQLEMLREAIDSGHISIQDAETPSDDDPKILTIYR